VYTQVLASYGHVRDLANKPGSVKPDEDWSLVWQLTGSGAAKMQELAAASAGCSALLLATDPDREGEAISWHITEELKVGWMRVRAGRSAKSCLREGEDAAHEGCVGRCRSACCMVQRRCCMQYCKVLLSLSDPNRRKVPASAGTSLKVS
jgi:hypothetical protein